ncbi:TIGR03016 family PEP-CTERM system-associated outer membrane protein [Geomonas sp. Red32]|uniref:TIGR03016 family PEP-CTERM system-associated outer membrane protein n=1 Tax=Geomonas sp. Red32 TaxID=2912856 RepID=UPI00202CB836|nr:TIGR03016 family PEP-CTERM system-associated outer membrane protein [Geomonas sp. Red32]MCM0083327.1 TIGR03016 family PEP-CTERM system-associated outer membrane protein [Geomonas sp. Red32]
MKAVARYMLPAVFLLLSRTALWGGELRFVPSLGVTEDMTDNANESATNKKSEFLTVIRPGVGINYLAPNSTLDLAYRLDYRNYLNGTSRDEFTHTMAVAGTIGVIGQFLKVDVSDTFSRVSIDVARDTTAESSSYAQTDENIVTVSPYLDWRFGEKSELKTGARYSDLRYWSADGIDRREAGGFAEYTRQLTPPLGLTLRYDYNRTRTEKLAFHDWTTGATWFTPVTYYNNDVSAGLKYEYSDRSFLYGTAGYSWQHFSYRPGMQHYFWDAGITKQSDSTLVALESKSRYAEDPISVSMRQITHSFRVERLLARGTAGGSVSYSKYEAADTAGFGTDGISISAVGVPPEQPGSLDREGVTIQLTGTRELSPRLTSSLTVTGDRISRRLAADYPYHLYAIATLNYLLGPRSTADLSYTYAAYRNHPGSGEGGVDVNRVVVQFKRFF